MGVGTFRQSQASRFAAERNDGGKVSKLMDREPVTVGLCSSGARSQRLSELRCTASALMLMWTVPGPQAGDIVELKEIEKIFGDNMPVISSTKGLTGHSLGATGAQEAIYCLLMLENDFVVASANIESIDPAAEGKNIAVERIDNAGLITVMTNNFGFGGTNGCLALRRFS